MERRCPHSSVSSRPKFRNVPPLASVFFGWDDAAVVRGDAAGPVTSTEWSAPAGSTRCGLADSRALSLAPPVFFGCALEHGEKRERGHPRSPTEREKGLSANGGLSREH